jgi:hypothetical protein
VPGNKKKLKMQKMQKIKHRAQTRDTPTRLPDRQKKQAENKSIK